MSQYTVNQPVPKEIETLFNFEDRSISMLSTQMSFDILLVRDPIASKQQEAFKGEVQFTVSVINGIPFIAVALGDIFELDLQVSEISSFDPKIHSVNIIAIEREGYVVKAIRTLRIDQEMMRILINAVRTRKEQKEEYKNYAGRNIGKHTTSYIISKGITQWFKALNINKNDT